MSMDFTPPQASSKARRVECNSFAQEVVAFSLRTIPSKDHQARFGFLFWEIPFREAPVWTNPTAVGWARC